MNVAPVNPPQRKVSDEAARPSRHARLLRAIVTGLASWWLFPRLFPYLETGQYAEAFAGPTEAIMVLSPAAGLLPCAGLAAMAYLWPSRAFGISNRLAASLPLVLVAGCVWLASLNRFTADDAFIAFRYARNWVEGQGLVFNPGERVEGYTNFLWLMLVAGGMKLGWDPVTCSQAVGLICFGSTLWLTYQSGRRVLPSAGWALIAAFLTGTHYTVLAFATSGLETSLVTCSLAAGASLVVAAHARGAWRHRDLVGLSLIMALGILTRMDFAIFAGILAVAAVISAPPVCLLGPYTRRALLIAGPAAVLLAAWLIWKWSYYGQLLPNTYYAKRAGPGAFSLGLQYLADFARSYRMSLPLIIVLAGVVALVRRRHLLSIFAAMIAAWLTYVAAMGGDFIEYRFLAPVVPVFMLLLVWTLAEFRWGHGFYLPALVLLWTVHGSVAHFRTYGWDAHRAEPVAHLRWQTTDAHWAEAGRALNQLFGTTDVSIATTCAGILPYHGRLRTLDMHGLTDAQVAREGLPVSNRPGHKRIASEAILRSRKVTLVVGHPRIEWTAALADLPLERLVSCAQCANAGVHADILAIPISAREVLLAWYLTPHPAIDEAIRTRGWRVFSVTASPPGDAD